MTNALILAATALALMACKDKGACLDSTTITTLQPTWVGKTMILIPITQKRCLRWEFPDGRPPEAGQ